MNSNKFKCCGETANPDSGISVYDWAIKDNKDIIPKNKLPEFYSKDEVDLFIRDIEHDEVKIINGDWYINGQYAGRAAGPKGDKGDAGDTPYIQNDYWYINGTNTLIKAVGLQGPQGKAFTYEDFTKEQLLALKGEPGKDGKNGIPGANGKDGNQTEYIYTLSSSETAPSKPSSLNVDNYCPIGWSTVPQQISKLYKFLYISSRKKVNGVWGDFSTPVLFSRYAERGSTGGHYEFRYKNSEKQPTKPIGNGIGNGWTREPSTPTDGKFTWMSQALCQDDDYGEWSEPIRITGDNGKNGEDGKSFEFIYINYTPGDNGAYPSISYNTYIDDNGIEQNPNNDDFVPRGWTDNPTGVSEKNQYEWFSTREKVKGVWSLFSFPVIWSKWGERGQDGDGYEYIYLLSNIEPDNPTPSDYETNNNYLNLDEYVKLLSGWTDEPQGVSEEYLIEWVSVRRRKNSKWLPFSKPAEWARWSSKGTDGGHWVFAYIVSKTTPLILPDGSDLKGWTYEMPENVDRESGYGIYMTLCFVSSSGIYGTWSTPIRISGEDGRPGTDGNFTEFIYTRTTKDSTAIRNNLIHLLELLTNSSGIDRNENDFIPDGWFDHPQGVDDLNCYEWVSTRTRKGTNTWEDFSTPSIWSKWGEKGMDGDGYEYVFFITPERTVPELNSDDEYNGKTKDDDEYLPYASETTVRWTDDPQDVSEINQYEWVSVRKKHKGVWGEFEDPKLWTRWAPKGIDGNSFEYIYHLSNKSNPKDITNPTPDDWEDETSIYQNVEEYVNELTDWSDDPQSPNRQNLFVYVCKRTRKYDSNKDKSLWTKFSDPSLWARWAEQSESGGHYEFRYKNAKPDEQGEGPEKPGTGTDGYSNNWTNIPSTPDIDNGEYTWMTQCYVLPSNNGEDVYGEWTNPIRITGGKGEHGADGTTFEFIYTRNNTGVAPITPTTSQEDDYIPSGWTDNPAGVTASLMYEYVSTRSKSNGIWSTFSIPVIWSKWGEKGMDGDGYEYIYKLTATNTNPGTPANSPQTDDYIPEGWTDDPGSVTQSLPYQWCSIRKKTNGTWGTWSTPAMWARYAEQGETGGHYEFRYKNSATQPAAPTGTGLTDGWAIAPTNPDINAGIYTWMSQSFVTPGQNGASDSYGTWTTPIRITGGQGEDGADGTDIEFVYTRNNTGVAPSTPATSQIDDYVPTGWTDNPQGVQADMMYEYVSMRYKRQDVWTAFTTPAVWSKWGEKGMDGDGYEYIYKLTATADVPTNPTPANTSTTEYQTADYVPTGWTDDPGSVSESTPYQWVCVRERHNGTWGAFSTPALWSRWATQGASGGHYEFRYKNSLTQPAAPTGTGESNGWSRTPTNPTESEKYTWMSQTYVNGNDEYGTWTTPIRITGLQGEHGADGTDIEFIYTRNNTGQTPAAPTGKNNEDDWSGTVDGITWTDNPQGVEMNLMYEYVSTRTKKSGESWSDYSTPVIWSKWGEKGMDGDGYEYIYKLSKTAWENDVKPPYPTDWETNTEYQKDDYKPSGWSDDPQSISADMPYLYVCVRKKKNGVWQEFSNAKLWLHWAEGVPGPQGDPGSSPYFADIDNEMDSVACDLNGYTVENYDAYIYVHVWYGSKEEDLTKLTVNNSITNFTITPDKDNKRIRVRVSSGTQIAQVNKINITVASANSGDKSLHFVLNGVRAGANGNPAIVYSLVPSVSNVIKKKDGSYSVYNVSCTRLKNVGGVITDNTTDGTISYKIDNGTENYNYVNNRTISVTEFSKSIQFIFRVNGTIVDVENIPMISDGTDSNGTSGGNDAVNVSLSPEEVIVTQSTTSPYNIDLSNAKTVVSVNEGGVPKTTFSITNITGMYCTASNTGNNTIEITGIDQSGGTYYDNGYVTFDVIYNGKTYNKRFNFYANLLGTWKRSVEAGVETVVAGLTQYLKDDNGNIITSKSLRNDINDATQDLSKLSQTVITQGQNIQSYNARLSTAEQNVSTIQRNAVTRNLLARGKWVINNTNYPDADYDAANDRWYDKNHVAPDDIYSPVVNLKKGKYCFYGYIPSSSNFDGSNISLTKGATWSNPAGTAAVSPYDTGGISTDTIIINNKTYERWYAVFNLDEDSKCSVNLWGSANNSDVAVPCLCEGEHPNIDSSTSMIKQTADEINLAITNKLGETGININGNSREINLIAGKVNFKTSSGGTNPYISITSDGKIKATDGDFSGKITANSGKIAGDLDVTGGFNVKSGTTTVVAINGIEGSTGSSNGNITILDAKGLYIKRGDEGFRLTTNGFQRWNSSSNSWVNFYGGRYVRTISLYSTATTLYNVSLNDDVVIAKSSVNNAVLNIPSSYNIPEGKILTIINTGGVGIHIRAGSLTIQGAAAYSQVTLNINDRMEFIYSNNKWYANYMPKVDSGS